MITALRIRGMDESQSPPRGAVAIGTAITRALKGTGHSTVVLDRDGDGACGLSSEASTSAAAAAVLEDYGRCDLFVHCAAAFEQ
jgi:NAD(P)-dependent dehydrogenase (short-subunit alcohol dehydrogenase family)